MRSKWPIILILFLVITQILTLVMLFELRSAVRAGNKEEPRIIREYDFPIDSIPEKDAGSYEASGTAPESMPETTPEQAPEQAPEETPDETPQDANGSPPGAEDAPERGDLPDVDLSSWELRLVNAENPVEESFSVRLTSLPGGQTFDARASEALLSMYNAAREQNLTILLNSGYRNVATQRQLYENRLRIQRGSGLSEEEARRTTLQMVAYPGTSEHNLGLAIDILDRSYSAPVTAAFANTELGQWLRMNCADFGFILRYPEDKTEITGFNFEPWHFRYVGITAARYIMDNSLTLEEFLDLYT